jgi:hypothetical protein
MTRFSGWMMMSLAFVLACSSAALRGQEIAQLAPSDTGVLLVIDNLNSVLDANDDDPMAQQLRGWLGRNRPMAWRMLEGVLEMDGRQMLATYFGRQFGVLVQRPGDHQPAVMVSRIDADAGTRLIDRLELQPQAEANVGEFRVFQTGDGKARMAISNQWLLVSGTEHAAYFQQVLGGFGQAPALDQDATFKQWVGRLPQARLVTLYVRNDEQQQVHALGLSYSGSGQNVSLHYAGRSPQWATVAQRGGDSPQPTFGPLPASTLMGMHLNLWNPNEQMVGLLDRLIAPQKAQADLLPQLEPPLVTFMGQVAPGGAYPAGSAPVMGLAIRMRSGQAAELLNRAMNNLTLLANVATMQWGTPPLMPQLVSEGGSTFTVVDAGPALQQKTGRAEAAALRFTYGPVGDWYLLCTHDGYFRQALKSPTAFAGSAAVKALPTPAKDGTLAHVAIDPSAMAQHLGVWLDHLDAQRTAAGLPLDAKGQRLMMTLGAMQKILPRFSSIWGRIQAESGGVMVGQIEMVAAK